MWRLSLALLHTSLGNWMARVNGGMSTGYLQRLIGRVTLRTVFNVDWWDDGMDRGYMFNADVDVRDVEVVDVDSGLVCCACSGI